MYAAFDPVGLGSIWPIGEVARVVTALPDLNLPWKKGVASHSLAALDEAVFNAGIKKARRRWSTPMWLLATVPSEERVIVKTRWTTISEPWLCFWTPVARYAPCIWPLRST
jgi:hypothetical protein